MLGSKSYFNCKGENEVEEEAEKQEDQIKRHGLEVKVRNFGGWTGVVAAQMEKIRMQNQ